MTLKKYNEKRNFEETEEPEGKTKSSKGKLKFVVQKHDASRLHYDFRLELGGVLKSWAVPKGPSMDPEVKRLAMHVEDHPYAYKDFEGIIPEGNYGAGTVIVWDEGTYEPQEKVKNAKDAEKLLKKEYENGAMHLVLHGKKLKGMFNIFKFEKGGENSWLLAKKDDEFSTGEDITDEEKSVKTGRTLKQVEKEEG